MMDPITLAITAALGNLGAKVINDAYDALKAALQHKFGIDSDLVGAVEKLEKKPDSEARKGMLKEEVANTKADQDPELKQTAEALIEAIKSQPGGAEAVQQIINQTVTGDHNIFSGSGDVTVNR